MRVKVTTLYCLICSFGNFLHVYQICDEYLRYDVTTNVQVTVPENIVFPSITLCVDLMDSLNWSALSLEARRKLISRHLSESATSILLKNPSLVLPMMQKLTEESHSMLRRLFYNELVNMFTVAQIMNVSAPLHEVIQIFATIKLVYNESQQESLSKENKEMDSLIVLNATEAVQVQFIIDRTYIRLRDKCFTLRLRPGLNKIINYDDLVAKYGLLLFLFESRYNRQMRIYLSSDGHLNTPTDSWLLLSPNQQLSASFLTHESVLLEYPYKSNCRDYTKDQILSRHQCRYDCFKSLIISRFNRISGYTYAYDSDNLHLRQMVELKLSLETRSMPVDIVDQCQKICLRKECRSVSHIHFQTGQQRLSSPIGDTCSLNHTTMNDICRQQKLLQKSLKYLLLVQGKPGTRTETQPAIPLISFMTGLFSTFGFWLGLSVFGSGNFFKILWSHTRKKEKLNPRTQQNVVRIIRQQQPTSHGNSSWKQVKVN